MPSSLLVPQGDPTLLFTNAGMVQFKKVFLGEDKRNYQRAVSVQKCVRAGGKHNDLENVGYTARHHTFFEMLGNFSFGDYFKADAIKFAWEFLTKEVGLDKDKLWVSVYQDDDEAFKLWEKYRSKDRILRLGEKDNFWAMGDTGPCGPCSEIHVDQGSEVGCGRKDCDVECDCDRYLEIWNLVFMQFNRDAQGKLHDLPKPSIDTGMGLERITAVLQGVKSNYETDGFQAIIRDIESMSHKKYGDDEATDVSMRAIADHARAVTFLIKDGVFPSNDGRGYVLRRILRRAVRHGRKIGIDQAFLHNLSTSVSRVMSKAYPELKESLAFIQKVIQGEETRFAETLDRGLSYLEDALKQHAKAKHLPGEVVFMLYDTYGFPLDLTADVARERDFSIDEAGFEAAMVKQRERGKAAWKGDKKADSGKSKLLLSLEDIHTEFLGYTDLVARAKVLKILSQGKLVKSLKKGQSGEVVVDRTPFYGESGGQVGDTGVMRGDGVVLQVQDTQRPREDLFLHQVKVKEGALKIGMALDLQVDQERRHDIVLNHSATHLMHAALRYILGEHVSQAGSLVTQERLRFDLTHFQAIETKQLKDIEAWVNHQILQNVETVCEYLPYKEALQRGAIALFGEKYGDKVRVMHIGSSTELCGGVHVDRTGDIGFFKFTSESSISSGVRRVEAVTGMGALNYVQAGEDQLIEAAQTLKGSPTAVALDVKRLDKQFKESESQNKKLRSQLAQNTSKDLIEEAKNKVEQVKLASGKQVNCVGLIVSNGDANMLRQSMDRLRQAQIADITMLAAAIGDKVTLILGTDKKLSEHLPANELIKPLANLVGGGGGGRKDMAQAGGSKPEMLEQALKKLPQVIRDFK